MSILKTEKWIEDKKPNIMFYLGICFHIIEATLTGFAYANTQTTLVGFEGLSKLLITLVFILPFLGFAAIQFIIAQTIPSEVIDVVVTIADFIESLKKEWTFKKEDITKLSEEEKKKVEAKQKEQKSALNRKIIKITVRFLALFTIEVLQLIAAIFGYIFFIYFFIFANLTLDGIMPIDKLLQFFNYIFNLNINPKVVTGIPVLTYNLSVAGAIAIAVIFASVVVECLLGVIAAKEKWTFEINLRKEEEKKPKTSDIPLSTKNERDFVKEGDKSNLPKTNELTVLSPEEQLKQSIDHLVNLTNISYQVIYTKIPLHNNRAKIIQQINEYSKNISDLESAINGLTETIKEPNATDNYVQLTKVQIDKKKNEIHNLLNDFRVKILNTAPVPKSEDTDPNYIVRRMAERFVKYLQAYQHSPTSEKARIESIQDRIFNIFTTRVGSKNQLFESWKEFLTSGKDDSLRDDLPLVNWMVSVDLMTEFEKEIYLKQTSNYGKKIQQGFHKAGF